MHMADALLSPAIGLGFYGITAGVLGVSAARASSSVKDQAAVPFMGVMGAFVFSAQMLNFSIPGTGSSGHLLGSLLLSLLFGPEIGVLVIASVIITQCLLFNDGGLLALGANIFNMGIVPAYMGTWLFSMWAGPDRHSWGARRGLAVLASVVTLEAGALAVTLQTMLSRRTELPFPVFASFMLGIHLPIAVVEGLVTVGVLSFLDRTRPDISGGRYGVSAKGAWNRPVIAMLSATILCGMVFSWFASSSPDGLEWSISRTSGQEELAGPDAGVAGWFQGIQQKTALLPDYSLPNAGEESPGGSWGAPNWQTSFSGIVGSTVVLLLVAGIGWLVSSGASRKQHLEDNRP